jgi:hypothetical protein
MAHVADDALRTMPLPKERAWFPAKRYGYGWGLPRRWPGWLVFIGYVGAFVTGIRLIPAAPGYFFGYAFGITALLVAICWWVALG